MDKFSPTDLANWTGGAWRDSRVAEGIGGFCFDARNLCKGDCFVALTHGNRDGHEFVGQAMAQGASAALVERPLDLSIPQLQVRDTLLAMEAIACAVRQRFDGSVVGITGSCGKTSTKEMLRLLLGDRCCHATAGNWNNRVGVPMTLYGLGAQDYAVIETGINEPDEMVHLGRMIAANLVLVTNVGAAHLEKLQSLERIAAEKSELMGQASPDARLLLPAATFKFAAFQRFASQAIVLAEVEETVDGPEPREVVRYERTSEGIRILGTNFTVHSASAGIRCNAALAILAAQQLGIGIEDIRERLGLWEPEASRGRVVAGSGQTFYIDCYNANPDSMLDALAAFQRSVPVSQSRGYVLGAMNELGDTAVDLHRKVGQAIQLREEDRVWLVGPESLTAAYCDGLPVVDRRVLAVDSIEKIKSEVAEFHGALFLKGSRSYALEQLLPNTL